MIRQGLDGLPFLHHHKVLNIAALPIVVSDRTRLDLGNRAKRFTRFTTETEVTDMNARSVAGLRLLFPFSFFFALSSITTSPYASRAWHQNDPASAAQSTSSSQSGLGSLDDVIKIFYESLSFPEGKGPDWVRFRSLFASATTPSVRMPADGISIMDRESSIAFFDGRIKKGTLKSFAEKEIGQTTEVYGNLAQVFSSYEKRVNLAEAGKPTRGINSLQLFFKDKRWWISSLAWQDEIPDKPIPKRYLKRN